MKSIRPFQILVILAVFTTATSMFIGCAKKDAATPTGQVSLKMQR